MMNQSTNDPSQMLPPQATNYIPPSVPSIPAQYQQQPTVPNNSSMHSPPSQYQSVAPSSSETDLANSSYNGLQQQQQMAMRMQMQNQPWMTASAGGYPNPYMMPYQMGPMMMMPPQMTMERPASRQSTRPPSRQSNAAPVSSSRSVSNGQNGNSSHVPVPNQALLANQPYGNYLPPGMFNPWFDPYWQSFYANYQNPYNFGYTDEMMNYVRQTQQGEEDRYSQHSAAYSQSKISQHSSSMHTWGSIDSLNGDF